MNEIRLIRLTSGEEILATMLKENQARKKKKSQQKTIVKNPILLIPDRDKIGFIPYMSYADIEELIIKEEHIMFNVRPSDELKEQYKNMIDGPNKIQTQEPLKILT